MSKVTFRLPSKAVQYGYIEVETDVENPDFEMLGSMYVHWALAFRTGEEAAKKAAAPPDPQLVDTSLAERNLKAQPMRTDAELRAALGSGHPDVEAEAERMLTEGLGPTTTLPWEEEVQAAPKPWQKKAVANAVTEDLL